MLVTKTMRNEMNGECLFPINKFIKCNIHVKSMWNQNRSHIPKNSCCVNQEAGLFNKDCIKIKITTFCHEKARKTPTPHHFYIMKN